jgi:hypothetical protein
MEVKLSMAIASHLSDAQHEIASGTPESKRRANQRIIFIKSLVFENSNLDENVTVDYLNNVWEDAVKYN